MSSESPSALAGHPQDPYIKDIRLNLGGKVQTLNLKIYQSEKVKIVVLYANQVFDVSSVSVYWLLDVGG